MNKCMYVVNIMQIYCCDASKQTLLLNSKNCRTSESATVLGSKKSRVHINTTYTSMLDNPLLESPPEKLSVAETPLLRSYFNTFRMYVCMYVCMYICMSVCIYYVYMSFPQMYVCTYVCIYYVRT